MRVNPDSRIARVAVVGAGAEFEALIDYLSTCTDSQQLAGLEHLLTLDSLRSPPDYVLLLHSRVNQFAQGDVDVARRVLSDAKWLGVIGSHAESESRSGRPLRGIERVHWTASIDRFARLDYASCEAESPASDGNPTEQVMALNAGPRPFPYRIGVVAASDRVAAPVLDACAAAGFCVERLSAERLKGRPHADLVASLDLCIWLDESTLGRNSPPLQAVASTLAPCPILVLSDFVRWEDRQEFVRQGASDVLARPFILEDLVSKIGRLARPSTLPARTGRRHAS